MRIRRLVGPATIATMLIASPAISSRPAPAPAAYIVDMTIRDGDRMVGSRTLTMAAGEAANVEIGDAAGNRYAVRMTATPHGPDTVAIESSIAFASGGVRQTASPNMVIAFDAPAAIAFGLDRPPIKPFRLDFTVRQIADRPS